MQQLHEKVLAVRLCFITQVHHSKENSKDLTPTARNIYVCPACYVLGVTPVIARD
jgi:hypothetical protein